MATKKKTEAQPTQEVDSAGEVISEQYVQVPLFKFIPVTLDADATKLSVKNIGGGEVYVSNEGDDYASKDVVRVGETMEFNANVILTSETVPNIKITQIK